jgi:hypothetical protein
MAGSKAEIVCLKLRQNNNHNKNYGEDLKKPLQGFDFNNKMAQSENV